MSNAVFAAIVTLSAFVPASVGAQSALPQASAATDLKKPTIEAALAKQLAELAPTATVSDRLAALADIGKYNVAVATVVRPAGRDPRALSHDKVTEVYYILKGSGVQVTGTLVGGTHQDTSKTIGPGMSSEQPLLNPTSSRLGPGDIQIIPPGLGHQWSSIDAGGIQYLIFRIDPERVLAMSN
jgi:mannose-6-phosphate isomerase-like protein (cupin superfamily)